LRRIFARGTFSLAPHCLLAVAAATMLAIGGGVWRVPARADDGEKDEAEPNREYRIKAAYLYQFGRYIEWPATTFADARSPFVIGILGESPLAADLDELARVKQIQNRPIVIRRFAAGGSVVGCHILFLPASLAAGTQTEAIRQVSGQGVLLVGEVPEILAWGGVVRFVVEENKVRIHIARKAARREGLTISAKLLQVAHVVD
jgi:hypothetical protein